MHDTNSIPKYSQEEFDEWRTRLHIHFSGYIDECGPLLYSTWTHTN